MKRKQLARFKRDIVYANQSSSNRARVVIDPRTKYSRIVRTEAKQINELLRALEESGNINSWASKILFNKLSSPKIDIIQGNRVDVTAISKDKSMPNLTYIRKSINEFKRSKTSTPEGIAKRVEDERQFVAEQTNNVDFARSLTEDELAQIYKVFNDEDYKRLTESGLYDSDEVFTWITEAKEEGLGKRAFIDKIKEHSEDGTDVETRNAFRNIYDKFVTYS